MGGGGSGKIDAPEPRYLAVGRVLRPHGIRGELRVEVVTDFPERLDQHAVFYLAPPNAPESVQSYPVQGMRWHKGVLLLKLVGCDDRNAADGLRGKLVQIPIEDAVPLEEGEYYHFEMSGVRVETEGGEQLGRVVEVLSTRANDVYVVRGPGGELLLPAVEGVVRELDVEGRRMVVRLLPGMQQGDKG
jgi:16S rRNA processing protein RimM